MTVIEMARELGKKIQQEESYVALMNAQKAVEEDDELQEKIAEFNMKRYELTQEITKPERDDKKIEELSKGMAQKVQFITTVLHEPELLIFDEPFSGFDPINADLLKTEILELQKKGATIIFSTHNMSSVEELCNNIVLLDKAQVILSGSVKDIRKSFRKNVWEIVYTHNNNSDNLLRLPPHYTILHSTTEANETTIHIKLQQNEAPNNLLNTILAQKQIISFREILPTMNEIFIENVTKN